MLKSHANLLNNGNRSESDLDRCSLWMKQACGFGLIRCWFLLTIMATTMGVSGLTPQTTLGYEKRIAVLIGLGEYETGRNKGVFRNLPVVSNDLEAVGKALLKLGFEEILIFSDQKKPLGSPFDYRPVLLPEQLLENSARVSAADIERIITQLLEKVHKSGSKDLLLIYFTGHGGVFGKADRVLALPQSEKSVRGSYYRVRALLNNLADKAPTADKLLIVDACADELGISGNEGPGTRMEEELPPFLFASRAGEAAFYDKKLGMSVFTYYFVDALVRAEELLLGDGDGSIDNFGILEYLNKFVPRHSTTEQKKAEKSRNVVQHPYGSDSKRLVIANYKTTRPPPNANVTGVQRDNYLRSLSAAIYGSDR